MNAVEGLGMYGNLVNYMIKNDAWKPSEIGMRISVIDNVKSNIMIELEVKNMTDQDSVPVFFSCKV